MYNPSKPYKHELLSLIESTWQTPYVSVTSGTYPIIKKKFKGLEVQHTDGIGTKGIYHTKRGTYKEAVLDALAMNLNDLALVGAVPYALSDHITLPDQGSGPVLAIIRALSAECKKRKIAIVGGETSHHDNVDGLDIGMTVSGFILTRRENRMRAGDLLVGFKSSGLHSNGFTKVRALFRTGEWREDFVRPTAIYLDTILEILKRYEVHGMMHITGGAFTKLKDVLKKCDAYISAPRKLAPQPIFSELKSRGLSDREMYTTFNCGIGFVLSAPEKDALQIVKEVKNAAIIGRVERGEARIH